VQTGIFHVNKRGFHCFDFQPLVIDLSVKAIKCNAVFTGFKTGFITPEA